MLDAKAKHSPSQKLHVSAGLDGGVDRFDSVYKAQENLVERMARLRRDHGLKGSPALGEKH